MSNGTSLPASRSVLPDQLAHPDDARYRQVLVGVERLGAWSPQEARTVAAALYAEVARNPSLQRIDEVVMGSSLVTPLQVFAIYRPYGDRLPVFHAEVPVATAVSHHDVAIPAHVDNTGYLTDAGITRRPMAVLEHGTLQGPHAIVMHRTGGANAASALSAFASGTGTHFLIDKDGTIYQTASLQQKTHHVGKIRSRCDAEDTCAPGDQQALNALGFAPKPIHDREKVKPYPERFPMNEDSIGIEVVSRHAANGWETPTPQQQASIGRLVGILQQQYGLGDRDVYEHDIISYKTQGEGAGLYRHDGAGADGPVVQPRGPAR